MNLKKRWYTSSPSTNRLMGNPPSAFIIKVKMLGDSFFIFYIKNYFSERFPDFSYTTIGVFLRIFSIFSSVFESTLFFVKFLL